jgi:hypothetical protein
MRLKANLLLDQEGVGFLLFLHGIEAASGPFLLFMAAGDTAGE